MQAMIQEFILSRDRDRVYDDITPDTVTQNCAPSYSSSGNPLTNLFFKWTRDVTENPLFITWLEDAWSVDPLATMRILFHGRDCRGGKGDRAPFIKAMAHIFRESPAWFYANLIHIPEYGRYLDWIEIMEEIGYPVYFIVVQMALQLTKDMQAMYEGKPVSLLAKWIPSEKKRWDRELNFTNVLCSILFHVQGKVTSYHYKRLRTEYLTPLRAYINIVERKMCAQEWDTIEFSKVPGVAMHRLKKAFERNAPEEFQSWILQLKKDASLVKSKTVYPHTLVSSIRSSMKHCEVAEAQWENIVKETLSYGALSNSVVVCDVSGSMEGTPMDVSIALGLLIATVAKPPFQNALITFHENPSFFDIPSHAHRLKDKVDAIQKMPWGGSTNLTKVFVTILERAKCYSLKPDDMPSRVYILSDMQFDMATQQNSKSSKHLSLTTMEYIRRLYQDSGYSMPEIVFWNLRSNDTHDYPVQHNEHGVTCLSGFSPSILKMVLQLTDLTPMAIVESILRDKRYHRIQPPAFSQ